MSITDGNSAVARATANKKKWKEDWEKFFKEEAERQRLMEEREARWKAEKEERDREFEEIMKRAQENAEKRNIEDEKRRAHIAQMEKDIEERMNRPAQSRSFGRSLGNGVSWFGLFLLMAICPPLALVYLLCYQKLS